MPAIVYSTHPYVYKISHSVAKICYHWIMKILMKCEASYETHATGNHEINISKVLAYVFFNFKFQMSFSFIVLVKSASQIEADIVAVERVVEYTNVPPEVR